MEGRELRIWARSGRQLPPVGVQGLDHRGRGERRILSQKSRDDGLGLFAGELVHSRTQLLGLFRRQLAQCCEALNGLFRVQSCE